MSHSLKPQTTVPRLRARLIERASLRDGLRWAVQHKRCIVISSPAGYGKTSALVQMLSHLPAETCRAWVGVEPGDDGESLLGHLAESLDAHDPPWRVLPAALPRLLRQQGPAVAARAVTHALQGLADRRGVIVVDDVHALAGDAAFGFLDELVAGLPDGWTLVLSGRVEPPLRLARLRLRGEVAEFREPDLRFTASDVHLLASTLGVALVPGEVQDLCTRTTGWPAGLMISLMSRGASTHATPTIAREQDLRRVLFDFLAQEVLQQLPDDLRLFLLRCSVLPTLSAQRCLQLSGDPRSAAWLQEIERRDLFVTVLEGESVALRLHDLFRSFLQHRARIELADELPTLCRRAAEMESDAALKALLLLQAGLEDEAMLGIVDAALPLLENGSAAELLHAVASFGPSTADESRPEVRFVEGLSLFHDWAYSQAAPLLLACAQQFEARQQWALAAQARAVSAISYVNVARVALARQVLGATFVSERRTEIESDAGARFVLHLAAFVLSTQDGPAEESPRHLNEVLASIDQTPDALAWLGLLHTLYVYVGRPGVAPAMHALAERQIEHGSKRSPFLRARALALQAWLVFWRGDVDTSTRLLRECELDAHWSGSLRAVELPVQLLGALHEAVGGRPAAAVSRLQQMAQVCRTAQGRRAELLYVQWAGQVAAAAGDIETVASSIEATNGRMSEYDWTYLAVSALTLEAEHALLQGHDRLALERFRQASLKARDCDWWGLFARVSVGHARAAARQGKDPSSLAEARRVLLGALVVAEEADEVGGLVLCGPDALRELCGLDWGAAGAPEELTVLHRARQRAEALHRAAVAVPALPTLPHQAGPSSPTQPGPQPLNLDATACVSPFEGLTARETEVLALIGEGQANKHIARQLGLSPHTVKRHVARLLDKTGLNSRGQLAAHYHRADAAEGSTAPLQRAGS